MKFWLTTQWPPRKDGIKKQSPGIWLPEGRHSHGARIKPGDLVAVYEAASGRTILGQDVSGTVHRIPCSAGREGVIFLGCVEKAMQADSNIMPEKYLDGTEILWRWYAPVNVISRSGFVGRQQLLQILGHKPNYTFRGYGELNSGLRELTGETFEKIRQAFTEASPPKLPLLLVLPGHTPVPGSIESEAHRALKEYIASNPATALNEPGMYTVKVEYSFGTGDRADIVLADQYNRIVGVEIETEVGDMDHLGPLQAIKYRRMLEYGTQRSLGDSRSLLIAYKISTVMKNLCAKYEIQCVEIPHSEVNAWIMTESRRQAIVVGAT